MVTRALARLRSVLCRLTSARHAGLSRRSFNGDRKLCEGGISDRRPSLPSPARERFRSFLPWLAVALREGGCFDSEKSEQKITKKTKFS